ncbi:hypothetical protein BDF14DRAFT_1734024 [Spinellus fusiger]|nr:hypothetical protein BDF14DRAFT_1734024 [Spinellus fusiger]
MTRTGEGKVYQLLQYISRVAVWAYFRHVKVIHRAPVPATGPLLVAGNHMNMVLDPAMLIATFPHGRPCHFWALARFFRVPLVGKVLRAAGVLPVDTKTHSNAKLFESTLQCLGQQGVIALFPEGTSYTAPHHLPFKDGLSWATFEYLSQQALLGCDPSVSIVPVGITYSTKNKWRSDVIVEQPILVTRKDLEAFQQEAKQAVKQLTARIAQGVERSTINSPDWETANVAMEAKSILLGDSRGVRLEEYVRVFVEIFCLDPPTHLHNREAFMELRNNLTAFHNALQRLRLSSLDIRMYENKEITLTRALLRCLSNGMALFFQLPLFLPGMLVNLPLYLLGRLVNSFEKYTESVAQDKLVVSLLVVLPLYSTGFYWLWKTLQFSLLGLAIALVLMPLFAWYHIALVDKRYDTLKQVIASWRVLVAVTGGGSSANAPQRQALEEAVHLRRWCSEHLKALLVDWSQAGNVHAQYLVDYGKPLFEEKDTIY